MKLSAWAATDVGKKRDHNEDSLCADAARGLFVVADGMGGHAGGDRASRMAVEIVEREVQAAGDFEAAAKTILRDDPSALVFPREVDPPESRTTDQRPVIRPGRLSQLQEVESDSLDDDDDFVSEAPTDPSMVVSPPPAATVLRAAARAAGRAIFDAGQGDESLAGMGTTLTALLFDMSDGRLARHRAFLVHVGDSRAYLVRGGQVTQLTEDHSWIAEQVRAGNLTEDEAKDSKFKHVITRSVGFERDVDVDLLRIDIERGDHFVLCSDGMSNFVGESDLAEALVESGADGMGVAQRLVDLANQRGGDDNITIVLVGVDEE